MSKHRKIKTVLLSALALMTVAAAVQQAQALAASPLPVPHVQKSRDGRIINVSTQNDAQGFIKQMGNEAISFLGDDSLSENQKKQQFETFLAEHFDMKTIGRFVMGPYWRNMSEQQKSEYQPLFEQLIVSIYSGRLSEYKGQELIVDGARPEGPSDYIVHSHVSSPDGETVPVTWHVRNKNGENRIVDVSIRDISMAISKKSEFASIIQKEGGNPEAILKYLRQQAG